MSLGRSQKAAPCSIQAAEERELKLLKRIRREVRPSHGPRRLEGRGAQSRLARVGYCLVFCTSLFGIIGGAAVRILAN